MKPLWLVCLAVAAVSERPLRAQGGWGSFGVTSSDMISCGGTAAVWRAVRDREPGFFLLYFKCSAVQLFPIKFLHIVLVKLALLSCCSQVGRYLKVLLFQLSCCSLYLIICLTSLCLSPCIKGPWKMANTGPFFKIIFLFISKKGCRWNLWNYGLSSVKKKV